MSNDNLKLFFIVVICFFVSTGLVFIAPCYAAASPITYYVDALNGKDFYSGKSLNQALQTIEQVKKIKLNPGDKVLFKSGCIWRESLIIKDSGTVDNVITIGSYGEGAKPIFSGSNNIINRGLEVRGNYIVIKNIQCRDWTEMGYKIGGQNVELINCEARDNGNTDSSYGDGFSVGMSVNKQIPSNITFTNCSAIHNLRRGIQVDDGTTGYITITGGEFAYQYGGNEADGIGIYNNSNITIDGVNAHHNIFIPSLKQQQQGLLSQGDGIQISKSVNPVVKNCRLHHNHNSGVILNYPQGGKIYNNLIYSNDRHGIANNGNSVNSLEINSNTVYGNEYGIYFYEASPTANVKVKNNIFYASRINSLTVKLEPEVKDSRRIFMDYNCFWSENAGSFIEWKNQSYSINEFDRYIDEASQGYNSIASDPVFRNVLDLSMLDFHLQEISPCIHAGEYINFRLTDFDRINVLQNIRPDIGANKYVEVPIYSSKIRILPPYFTTVKLGEKIQVKAEVTNTGSIAWIYEGNKSFRFRPHLYDSTGKMIIWDVFCEGNSWNLRQNVAPGQKITLTVNIPTGPGMLVSKSYFLGFDMVQENVKWFGNVVKTPNFMVIK